MFNKIKKFFNKEKLQKNEEELHKEKLHKEIEDKINEVFNKFNKIKEGLCEKENYAKYTEILNYIKDYGDMFTAYRDMFSVNHYSILRFTLLKNALNNKIEEYKVKKIKKILVSYNRCPFCDFDMYIIDNKKFCSNQYCEMFRKELFRKKEVIIGNTHKEEINNLPSYEGEK